MSFPSRSTRAVPTGACSKAWAKPASVCSGIWRSIVPATSVMRPESGRMTDMHPQHRHISRFLEPVDGRCGASVGSASRDTVPRLCAMTKRQQETRAARRETAHGLAIHTTSQIRRGPGGAAAGLIARALCREPRRPASPADAAAALPLVRRAGPAVQACRGGGRPGTARSAPPSAGGSSWSPSTRSGSRTRSLARVRWLDARLRGVGRRPAAHLDVRASSRSQKLSRSGAVTSKRTTVHSSGSVVRSSLRLSPHMTFVASKPSGDSSIHVSPQVPSAAQTGASS